MSSSMMLNHREHVLQAGDSSTLPPKMGHLAVFFPTHFSPDFQVHVGPFKSVYGRIHWDNSAQLSAVYIHAKMIRIGISKFFLRKMQAEAKLGGFFSCV